MSSNHISSEVVLESVGGRQRLVDQKSSLALNTSASSGCQVTGTIDEEGNWIGQPRCANEGCGGTCVLRSETSGSRTRYWCECI